MATTNNYRLRSSNACLTSVFSSSTVCGGGQYLTNRTKHWSRIGYRSISHNISILV